MSQTPLSIRILGSARSGKATIAGCLLYKLNGVDLNTMGQLEQQGMKTYNKIPEELRKRGLPQTFETPIHKVTITDTGVQDPDLWMLITTPTNGTADAANLKDLPSRAKIVVLVNKMDTVQWSESVYDQTVSSVTESLKISNSPVASAIFVPICATTGENFIELSSKSPWYAKGFSQSNKDIPEQGTLVHIIDEVHRS